MDWYCYFKERFTWGSNPYASVEKCRQIVDEMMMNPIIPSRISTEAAIDFLAAVRDFAGDGCFVHDEFATVMASLFGELHTMREAVEAADAAWAQEVDGEQGDGSGPPYVPGDYEVRPVDEDGEDPDDEPEPVEIPDPDDRDLYFTLKAMYGDSGEPGTTGTRTPFPDWDHISDWTATDWLKLQTYKDKVLAAAESGFMGISSVAGILAAAKGAMIRVPLPRQVELCMWATEVVDRLMFGLEDDLQEMCAGSLHSHEGRLVQKQLVSAANGHAQDSPD